MSESEKKNEASGDAEKNQNKLRYPRSIPFIIANEFCERFNFYGMRTILVLYLTRKLLYSDDQATVVFHLFTLLVYFFCIFGAIVADSWLGKYKTILWLSIVYVFGSIIISLGAVEIWSMSANVMTLLGLFLIAIGSGGIKPCVAAFGGEQFKLPEQAKQLAVFFSLFYFSINAGSLISTTVTPILREDVKCLEQDDCFPLAFGVPAILMAASILLFVGGKYLYKILPNQGNMLVKVCSCITNAISVRNLEIESNPREHWLDYAETKHGKKLIKETKILLNVLTLYLPLPFFWALFDQQGSRWTFQATRMNGEIGTWELYPDQMQVLNPLLILIFIPLYETVFYPFLSAIGIQRPLQKLTLGGVLAGIAFVISAIVEIKVEKTYPVLPKSGEAQLRIYNARNCDYTFSSNIPGHATFSLKAMDIFLHPNITITGKTQNFQITVTEATPEACQPDVSFQKDFTLVEAKAYGISLYGDAASRVETRDFVDNPQKSRRGWPVIRIIANIKSNEDIVFKEKFKAEHFRNNKTFNSQVEISSKHYHDVFVGENLVRKKMKVTIGGVYVLMIREDGESGFKTSLNYITKPNTVHMLWLIPQYFVMTLGEVMFSITGLTFSFTQAPDSMKSVIQGCWMLTTAVGNLIVVIIASSRFFKSQVLEFLLFATLMFVDMFIFMILAFRYKPIPIDDEDDK